MTTRTYYRAALLLPLVVPGLFAVGLLLEDKPPLLLGIWVYLFGSLLIGGFPYVLFAAGFLFWSRGRSDAQLRRAVLLAPLVYAGLLMVCTVAFLAVDGTLASGWDGFWALGGFGVAFGYVYVLLAELGRLLLRPAPTAAVPVAA
jgi:hypothetical protein